MPGDQEGLGRPWLCPCVLQVTGAGTESMSSAPAITCVRASWREKARKLSF